jgi:hypothetical protein
MREVATNESNVNSQLVTSTQPKDYYVIPFSSNSTPLNPALFEAMQQRFGDVRIVNAGEPRQVRYVPDFKRPGQLTAHTEQHGEQYACACPFCGDQRQRLFVNYQYGEFDPQLGRRNNHLLYCHNERCDLDPDNRNLFRNLVAVPLGVKSRIGRVVTRPSTSPPVPVEPKLPANLIPLSELPADHAAIRYIRSRQFDPQEIATVWGVTYSEWSADPKPQFGQRLVIPVYRTASQYPTRQSAFDPILAGWQARDISGGRSDAPKYLTMADMRKSQILYGLPEAMRATGPVWIVEGVTDAWRLGPGAVALLGKSLSQEQKTLIARAFRGRPVVVMLDRDAEQEALQIQHQLQNARIPVSDYRVVVADMPPGRDDPGDSTRDELFAATEAALSRSLFQEVC